MSNEKQTTAMQDLIDLLEVRIGNIRRNSDEGENIEIITTLRVVKSDCQLLLDKEREIIENTFVAGDERGTKDIPFNAEQYYNQTFK